MEKEQIIFVVETTITNQSDMLYIQSFLNRFYQEKINSGEWLVKFIYLNGKGNYKKRENNREIQKYVKMFRETANGISRVILCLDTDEILAKEKELKFIEKAKLFCIKNDYYLVWFYKDIERCFIGKKVCKKR